MEPNSPIHDAGGSAGLTPATGLTYATRPAMPCCLPADDRGSTRRLPRGAQETQIPVAFLIGSSSAPRPKRAIERTHRRDRRVQAPQSPCWLSPHRAGDSACLWHRYRQRHRPPSARKTLSTRSGNRWSVLAELYRAYEGQPVERRFISLRIDTLAQPLGHGGDGRVHTSDHWLWR